MEINGLDFLVQETFKLNNEKIKEIDEFSKENSFSNSSGLVYRFFYYPNYYIVKAKVVSELDKAFLLIEEGEIESDFVLQDENEFEAKEQINYFETERIELADIVKDQICNKRQFTNRDLLGGLTDLGNDWWVGFDSKNLIVSYQRYLKRNDLEWIQVGNLGDSFVACHRFSYLKKILESRLSSVKIVNDEKGFYFESSDENKNLESLTRLFVNGEFLSSDLSSILNETSVYYFQELATLRRFFKEIELQKATLQGANLSQ